jgi:hypothetical protein
MLAAPFSTTFIAACFQRDADDPRCKFCEKNTALE